MSLNIDQVTSLGLNPDEIICHQQRIRDSLKAESSQHLEVIDTCRLENGGIVALDQVKAMVEKASGFAGFVPAAGAASRYLQDLRPFESALINENKDDLEKEIDSLREKQAETWALPATIQAAIQEGPSKALSLKGEILESINLPKALQPCVASGETYLFVKHQEHKSLGLDAEVFITPPQMSQTFSEQLNDDSLPTSYLEQGPQLSTIRFTTDGEPYLNEEGQLSPVPAGHGTLVKLFPKVKAKYPSCHSILIRNIDNLNGTGSTALHDTQTFMKFHQTLLGDIQKIRKSLELDDFDTANESARTMLENFSLTNSHELHEEFQSSVPDPLRYLFKLQIGLFHFNPTNVPLFGESNLEDLAKKLFRRPLNTLGQVPNSGKDVGGTPLFAKIPGGEAAICLEVPHASPEDKEHYLSNPEKATHFNPVFVAAELTEDWQNYHQSDTPFWILAKKKVGLVPVVYHETVLYELLGNSILANAVFPAIPRSLFNPHKTASDTALRRIEDWLA